MTDSLSASQPEPVLEVTNVGYRYGQNWALSDISFSPRIAVR